MKFDMSPIDTATSIRPPKKSSKKHDDVNLAEIIGNDQSIPNPVTDVNIPPSTMPDNPAPQPAVPVAQMVQSQLTTQAAPMPDNITIASPVISSKFVKKTKEPKTAISYSLNKNLVDTFRLICEKNHYNQTEIIKEFLIQFCKDNQ